MDDNVPPFHTGGLIPGPRAKEAAKVILGPCEWVLTVEEMERLRRGTD
jgi:hypothetical protein